VNTGIVGLGSRERVEHVHYNENLNGLLKIHLLRLDLSFCSLVATPSTSTQQGPNIVSLLFDDVTLFRKGGHCGRCHSLIPDDRPPAVLPIKDFLKADVMAGENSVTLGDHSSFEEIMKEVSLDDCGSFDEIIFPIQR